MQSFPYTPRYLRDWKMNHMNIYFFDEIFKFYLPVTIEIRIKNALRNSILIDLWSKNMASGSKGKTPKKMQILFVFYALQVRSGVFLAKVATIRACVGFTN